MALPLLVKLGKKAKRIDRRTFKLSKYLKPHLPLPPAETSYVVKVPYWPMDLNDQLGDCVVAAMAHMIQQWTFFSRGLGGMVVPTEAQVLAAYEAIGGYVVGDPSTDNGCDMLTALNYWRNTGLAGHKIAGFVEVDPSNLLEVRQSIWMFGNLFTGLSLPVFVQGASDWTVPDGGIYGNAGQPGSWGGHCVPAMAESPETLSCVTWGERLKMSHNFFGDYCDEAYAVLSTDWVNSDQAAQSGFNLAQLRADIAAL
jgi:hypothetical protein